MIFPFLFVSRLGDLFRNASKQSVEFSRVGVAFVDTVTQLLSRLLDYRTVTETDDNINNKMSCTVNILVWHVFCFAFIAIRAQRRSVCIIL